MQRAILLMGPTAAGKSELALALAEVLCGEIVSVDSAQVFRGMDIGTAKPDAAVRSRMPHYLVDLVDPTEAYSAARFATDALVAIETIRARGRVPIVAGGTMLYFKALVEGLSVLPPADASVRASIDREATTRGWPALHVELARVDPQSAGRIAPTDAQRIQRALEVYRGTGQPLSSLQGRREAALLGEYLALALVPEDRAALHATIARRFDAMLQQGLVDELAALRRRFALSPELPSMRSVGYRQAWRYLEGEIDRPTLRASGIAATRQLAKRQLTWLRGWTSDAGRPHADAVPGASGVASLRPARLDPQRGDLLAQAKALLGAA
jgi:tRNA dimethylallyltransferase